MSAASVGGRGKRAGALLIAARLRVEEPSTFNAKPVHYVYILRCADDTLYTGYTTDPQRRVAEHNAGKGAKYTRGRTPVEQVHLETFDSQGAAMRREHAIKQFPRAKKEKLAGL